MNTHCKTAFSLVEVLVAMAIIVIAAVLFMPVADKLGDSNAKKTTDMTLAVLDSALEKYFETGKRLYPPSDQQEYIDFYSKHRFPFDCRDHVEAADTDPQRWQLGDDVLNLQDCEEILGVKIEYFPASILDGSDEFINVMLCLQLWLVPECREILETLPSKCIERQFGGEIIEPDIDEEPAAVYLITDGWGKPLNYWYDGRMSFPLLRSAGPDGEFDTDDDIIN
jgi:prepilin-type N-terminal cleavage/methylation domain-containing protein